MNQQSSPTMRFRQIELTILIQSPKEELCQKATWLKVLLGNVITKKEPSQIGCEDILRDYE
jgi:hypothetical protein